MIEDRRRKNLKVVDDAQACVHGSLLLIDRSACGIDFPLSGGASPLLMAGHRQVISKGIQNILIYWVSNKFVNDFACRKQKIFATNISNFMSF